MDPSLSDIRYFLAVASTLNISRAAEQLMIRQSSLSTAIKRLEEALGVELLVRGKTGVRLTKAGQRFVVASHGLVDEWQSVKSSTLNAMHEVEGHYTLGCHPNPSRFLLPLFLPELRKNHPRLEIQLVHDRSQVLNEMVVSARLDFAIVAHVVPHPDLVRIVVAQEQTGVWVRKDLSVSPDETTLMFDPEIKQHIDLLEELARQGINFHRTMSCSSVEVMWALVESGYAAAMMPSNPILHSHSRDTLKLAEAMPTVASELTLIYRADLQTSVAARQLVRTIRECCEAAEQRCVAVRE